MLLLIEASGGFGKTVRMREYAERKGKLVIWVELDKACNQKEFFYYRFLQQLNSSKIYEEDGDANKLCSSRTGLFVHKNREKDERMFQQLEQLNHPDTVIAFDNISLVKKEEIQVFLELLINQFQQINWFFAGREEPRFLVKYIVTGKCRLVEEKQLYFRKEEISYKIKKCLGESEENARKSAEKLMYYFGGWPAGVSGMIRVMQKQGMPESEQDWENAIDASRIEYFIKHEIFEQMPEKEFQFLKMISFLPELKEELICILSKKFRCEDITWKQVKTYFFVSKEANCKHMLPIFDKCIKKSATLEERRYISSIAAEYYISEEEYEKANDCILQTAHSEVIEAYLKQYFERLYQQGKIMLCVDDMLYFIQKGEVLSGQLMRFMAVLFNGDFDKRHSEGCQMDENSIFPKERDFYMELFRYNENPIKHRKTFICYFQEMKERIKSSKRIHVSCFGGFSVKMLENGNELTWRTKKGSELFALLYHLKGVPISRQALLNILWPNSIPKNAVTMLHNMIYNIRKELSPYGLKDLIQYKDKMYTLNIDWITSDDVEIQRNCEHSNDPAYLLKREDTFSTYPGQYLESIDGQWTIEWKEFYDKKYMECNMCLADVYMKQGEYKKALFFLKNILSIDNLKEDAVEKVLFCYGKMGERKAVQMEYRKFVWIMEKELNVEPCDNLKKMYEKAMKGAC